MGEDIEIVKGRKIDNIGKEWLKLFGARWWASEDKRGYYGVPTDVQTPEVADALKILKVKAKADDKPKGVMESLKEFIEKLCGRSR
jgi:hypothetical protein